MNFFDDWDLPRQLFTAEEFHLFYNAVYEYARSGKQPESLPTRELQLFFKNFRIKIDNDEERYKDVCRKRSEAGKKAHIKQEAANDGNSRPISIPTSESKSNHQHPQYHVQYQPQYHSQPQHQQYVDDRGNPYDVDDDDLPF